MIDSALQESRRYLASSEAKRSIDSNPYWPKWHSPWWHMVVFHEMGLADQIPKEIAGHLIQALKLQYPQDGSLASTIPCPCELGNIYQVLSAAGFDVDQELPWIRPWLFSRQMPDGGLSCDDSAYLAHPPASSIVGTIAPLEAVLLYTKRPFTPAEERFLDAGAQCLISRKLMLGCSAPHNTEEHEDEVDWLKPCFPRFYLYDVLRGLSFILQWADRRMTPVSSHAIEGVVSIFEKKFSRGQICNERRSYEGVGSRIQSPSGQWMPSPMASYFPLLNEVSKIGEISPYLTKEWLQAKTLMVALNQKGLIQ